DDPLADPACVPLYFVAKEASKRAKVVLSGEGADELFGGYNIYREPHSLACFQYVPTVLKKKLRKLAAVLPEGMKGKSFLERGTTPLEERYIGNAKMFTELEKEKLLLAYNRMFSNELITKNIYEHSIHQH
ncbi:asparagine synthase-related protein, partial [Desertibacillus haloalkaliphilus]|uniref:asparagine synthase-related protein n=1 Tax=Desertibacillus haloalkaliphilus TaxID=1328930 RepID=UPI001C267D44